LGFIFGKLIDVGMVVGIGFMFVATMLANTAVSALTGYFSDRVPVPGWLLQLTGIFFSLFVITMFLAIIFRALPNIKIRFLYILLGASVTALLFTIGNYVIGRYLGRTTPGSAFGLAGSLAVLLIWMYYSSFIILFGAEVTRAYAQRGRLRKPKLSLETDKETLAQMLTNDTVAASGVAAVDLDEDPTKTGEPIAIDEPDAAAPQASSPPE
jgi:membrane protein